MKCLLVVRKVYKQQKYEAKPHLGKNRAIDFAYSKIKSFCHYQTDYTEKWVKNCCDGGLLIPENFNVRKEELDQPETSAY